MIPNGPFLPTTRASSSPDAQPSSGVGLTAPDLSGSTASGNPAPDEGHLAAMRAIFASSLNRATSEFMTKTTCVECGVSKRVEGLDICDVCAERNGEMVERMSTEDYIEWVTR